MTAIILPTTPNEFVSFMQGVWEGYAVEPADEGTNIQLSAEYVKYEDARKVAKLCGMFNTGGSSRNGDPGRIWRWPNGEGVFITLDGDGASADVSKFTRRQRNQ